MRLLLIACGFLLGGLAGALLISFHMGPFGRKDIQLEKQLILHRAQVRSTDEFMRPVGERILCWVLCLRVRPEDKFQVYSTWGARCDKVLFVAKDGEPEADVLVHNYSLVEKMDLWNQAHRGWALIADNYLQQYDWFIKLDTDSYFIPDNFIHLLRRKGWRSNEVVYFGHTIFEQSRPITEIRAQFNLGAGYGVSQKLLADVHPYLPESKTTSPSQVKCPSWVRWGEDVKFADCLRYVYPSLLPNQTIDEFGRETFMPFTPSIHIKSWYLSWFYRGKPPGLQEKQKGTGCCSARPILWHSLKKINDFRELDYLNYEIAVDPIPEGRDHNRSDPSIPSV